MPNRVASKVANATTRLVQEVGSKFISSCITSDACNLHSEWIIDIRSVDISYIRYRILPGRYIWEPWEPCEKKKRIVSRQESLGEERSAFDVKNTVTQSRPSLWPRGRGRYRLGELDNARKIVKMLKGRRGVVREASFIRKSRWHLWMRVARCAADARKRWPTYKLRNLDFMFLRDEEDDRLPLITRKLFFAFFDATRASRNFTVSRSETLLNRITTPSSVSVSVRWLSARLLPGPYVFILVKRTSCDRDSQG